MSRPSTLIRRVALISAGLGAPTALGLGLAWGARAGLSSAVGTALGVLNLWALAHLVGRVLDPEAEAGRRARAVILLSGKGLALLAGVAALVVSGAIRALPLTAGLSVAAFSIVLAAARPEP